MLATLALTASLCGVPWDPVAVLPASTWSALRDGQVAVVCRVASLPAAVRDHLAEADGKVSLVMADPDQTWNDGCIRMEGVPSRQLIVAAQAGHTWVIHYRQGGFAPQEYAVVLSEEGGEVRELWRGWCVDEPAAPSSGDAMLGRVTRQCENYAVH